MKDRRPISCICCDQIGLTMEGVNVTPIHSLGKDGWKASAKIGSIFGAEVEGECVGYGPTKEIALERLKQDQKRLADSLWAKR